jgi:hypothetical protein
MRTIITVVAMVAIMGGDPAWADGKITETCGELVAMFGHESKLSDMNKEARFKKRYKGKRFDWKLEVSEISEGFLGGITGQFKCANGSEAFVADIIISYDSDRKGYVAQLEKGSVYNISGVMKRWGSFLGFSADDVW